MNKQTTIAAIVAMTEDRVIGKDGDLPWHYSEDLKRFKRKTIGSTIIMGRKTWQSIGLKPLSKRRNIVISRSKIEDAECYNSVELALEQVGGQIWIIGGGQIYQAALDFCHIIDVTWVPDTIDGEGLVRFPELNESYWQGGEIISNEFDSRLTHQLFSRIHHHT